LLSGIAGYGSHGSGGGIKGADAGGAVVEWESKMSQSGDRLEFKQN